MSSRPALLLQKQLYHIERLLETQELLGESDQIWGIEISLFHGSIFHWRVTLSGLYDSQWQGGIFQVDIIFDEDYNNSPPQIAFITIPFHPNIDMNTGVPCMDALINWNPNTTILELLVELQILLSEPVIENCVNLPAGDIYQHAPRLYNQMIQDSIVASRRLQAGLDPFETISEAEENIQVEIIPKEAPTQKKSIKHLSFGNYHENWLNLATSVKPNGTDDYSWFKKQQKDLLENHKYLLYGKFKSNKTTDLYLKKKNRLDHYKNLYKQAAPEAPSWEHEAQELLEWTRSLETGEI